MVSSLHEFACQWYYDKYKETGQLVKSKFTRRLLEEHGSVEKVIDWLREEIERNDR